MSGRLVEVGRISEFYDQMGEWSKYIVDDLWPDPARRNDGPLFGTHGQTK